MGPLHLRFSSQTAPTSCLPNFLPVFISTSVLTHSSLLSLVTVFPSPIFHLPLSYFLSLHIFPYPTCLSPTTILLSCLTFILFLFSSLHFHSLPSFLFQHHSPSLSNSFSKLSLSSFIFSKAFSPPHNSSPLPPSHVYFNFHHSSFLCPPLHSNLSFIIPVIPFLSPIQFSHYSIFVTPSLFSLSSPLPSSESLNIFSSFCCITSPFLLSSFFIFFLSRGWVDCLVLAAAWWNEHRATHYKGGRVS